MGRSMTPTYRIETWEGLNTSKTPSVIMGWNVGGLNGYGKPTAKNLAEWMKKYNDSYKFGGVNYHCSERAGVIIHAYKARIVRQSTGEVISEWQMEDFEEI